MVTGKDKEQIILGPNPLTLAVFSIGFHDSICSDIEFHIRTKKP